MEPVHLPPEIIETIIDTLAQDDPNLSSIQACALVCYSFHRLCRKHIFASINLRDRDTHDRLPSETSFTTPMLHQLLSTSPEIADHIRNLKYWIAVDNRRNGLVLETFKKITRLESLALQGYDGWVDFRMESSPFRPALLHLMHLPTLTRLRLIEIHDFVVADFLPCTNLEHLELERVAMTATDNVLHTNSPDSSIRLASLSTEKNILYQTLKICSLYCADGKPFFDFSSVHVLSMKIVDFSGSIDIPISHNLFNRCRQLSRITLILEVWDGSVDFIRIGLAQLLNPSMQTLKYLVLRIYFFSREDHLDPLCALPSELESIENSIIETIQIEIWADPNSIDAQANTWASLDNALAQTGWQNLRQVLLMIRLWDNGVGNHNIGLACAAVQLMDLLRGQFPKLSASNSISFDLDARVG